MELNEPDKLRALAVLDYKARAKRIHGLLEQMTDPTRKSLEHFGISDADAKEVALYGIICTELIQQMGPRDATSCAALISGIFRAFNDQI